MNEIPDLRQLHQVFGRMAIASMTFQASLRFVDQTLTGLVSILGATDGTVALRLAARSVENLIGCLGSSWQ